MLSKTIRYMIFREMNTTMLFFVVVFSLLITLSAFGQNPKNLDSQSEKKPYALVDLTQLKFTGDFDEMVKRRLIRVLVTYSKTHYFVDQGTQRGVTYEAFRIFENDLNKKLKKKHLRVHVLFAPVARDDLIPALIEGRGDIAAANLTITPERLKLVDFSSPIYDKVSEIVVTGPGAAPIVNVQDLSGKEVYIRKSASYYESIKKLNVQFVKDSKAPVKMRFAPEVLESEDILEMVNAGLVKTTIIDKHIAEFWKEIFNNILLRPQVSLRTGGEIGFMIRKNSPQLKAALDKFIARYPEGSKTRNILLKKYLKNMAFVKNATSAKELAKYEATVELFRKYGNKYELDYLLMMAQGYQESKLDQQARNASGAIGIMQVLPATGEEMNVGDITEIEPNVHAGVKYIRYMMNTYYAGESMDPLNRGLFAFASYNAGPGRISRLRKEAAKRGLDPNKWFNHVEVVAAEKIGRETVRYVSNIYKYYLAYKMVAEQREKRKKAKQAVK